MDNELLRLENISKEFSGNVVLKDVNFSVEAGEVRALVGENGAGKSTMIKIISGAHRASGGSVYLSGQKVSFAAPKDGLDAGVSVMYQELDLLSELTVVENVFLGIEIMTKFKALDRPAMERVVDRYLEEMNLSIDKNVKVGTLPIVMQQMVAAVKAMVHQAKIMILDEPSSSLTNSELEILYDLIRRLKKQGIAVIYVSHRLEEIFHICDSVTVLLDGRMVMTKPISEVTKDEVIEKMVGRKVGQTRLNIRTSYDAPYIFEAKNVSYKNILNDVSFKIKKGELYGILGLVGSGAIELGKLIYGVYTPSSGSFKMYGKPVSFKTPADALKSSVSYVSDERRAFGVFLQMSVEDNGMITSLRKFLSFKPLLIVDKRRKRQMFMDYVQKFNIKIAGPNQYIRFLSGGNQQKVLVARTLISDTEIIMMSCPTKGIDVGAKREIYEILLDCIQNGKTVIVVSQEITELVQICDRILMLKRGSVFKEYAEDGMSEELIYTELLS